MNACAIAAAVRRGQVSALAVAERAIAACGADSHVAVTRVLAERARDAAAKVDATIAAGGDPGPLAGVPYGVKDLFDVAGLPTTAGSAFRREAEPAPQDASAIRRLADAGAVLVATLNMDEFAYGFATINASYGTTRNPHDPSRLAGGSSGGSAAIVASGALSFSLGSDTNGSIRVPASLCGLYGLKPAHASLPLDGTFAFAHSFDDIGPFATNLGDLALIWEVLLGRAVADGGAAYPIRVARLGGRFRQNADPAQLAAIDAAAPDAPLVELPDIAKARSAAFLMTAYEGGHLHRDTLARDAMAYDPAVRDRLLAGALLPDALYEHAVRWRGEFNARLRARFARFDVLLAPATPCVAPSIADPRIEIDGALSPARADLGIHTQPITFTGLPSLCVPLKRAGQLPLGLQIIGMPGCEARMLRFAVMLEEKGLTGVTAPIAGSTFGAHVGELT
ncbi:AtzE family amidohydrolase [Novosphingobium olei]|uniref:AtzE family amidohydrolase n=1 Tax=Novosphingobium olei TaxID=2728851 RepID=UPI00308E2EE5|nr:AtzE family amidohydrolase [Novosphingobium olei]